ncbi:MAG: chorismate synthase, partial [Clostridia bacterium]|nr:chorismate synthase [Clostridia bacterium]
PIVFSVAVKPTPSIAREQNSVNVEKMENAVMTIKGRHDPSIVPRAVPCIEAAAAIAILDILLDEGFINERKYLDNYFEKSLKKEKYGLLGEKLGHSFSPEIHSMLADYSYKLFEVGPDKVESFIRNGDFNGLNVTIPYKKVVMELCDEVSEQAKRIGCVNTVKRKNGKLCGYNTDYDGFKYLLTSENMEINGKKCLILGTGASSGTVKTVLEDMGAREIIFISRNGEDNYGNIERHHDAQVIVNTTPMGMYPNNGECKVKLKNFTMLESCVDIVYNPLKTELIQQAEELKIKNVSGLGMLVAQAKYAAEIFTENSISDQLLEKIINKIYLDKSNIVIIGMPGSGKSSVGRIIAKALDRKFVDADKYFEQKMGMTAGEYITQHGEELFRKEESEVLCELGKMSGIVISTGGGAVTRAENYNHLHQNGKIVLIKRSFERLATRGRPLSQGDNALNNLWEKRRDAYKAFADVEVDNNRHISKTVDTILRRLGYENPRN